MAAMFIQLLIPVCQLADQSIRPRQHEHMDHDLTFISRHGPYIPIKLSVPDTMSILRVRSLSRKLFNTGTQLPVVTYRSTKMLGKEIELDDDLSDLHFFAVENEDTIVVHS
ncbi:unnamed protein product [Timema podura]|uniref:Ubiquitin-like domain-containing protein n=1 Tax=Timema podura TaxID=61482 RepID=A0ABN7NHD9_TIMPD|nr:unnamed protein product [Timema podura]